MYHVKSDYIARLRQYLLNTSELRLTEDPNTYVADYDPSVLQGFLVWNHSAYLAKEYEFPGIERVDFYIIPTFGGMEEETACAGTQYVGINIDVHLDIDSTGERMNMIVHIIRTWHQSLLASGICPITLPTQENYMILGNGVTQINRLASQPYTRCTVRYKLDFLNPLAHV